MAEVFDFGYTGRGPIERDRLDTVIATVQDRLDLVTVLRVRYKARLEVAGARWKTQCFLPSAVDNFDGSCAQQDASDKQGRTATPTNLWVSEGDSCRVWRCHSCGRRGDVIDLIEHADGLQRSTGLSVSLSAVRCAAKLAGVVYLLDDRAPDMSGDDSSELVAIDAPQRIVQPAAPSVDFARARAVNARTAKHWHEMLKLGPGYLARAELKRRGVTDEQVKRFVLGYALPKWRELVEALPKGAHAEAVTLGLLGRKRDGDLYDRFRDRLMFPYCDPPRDGRRESVTGFAGRSLTAGTDAPKWFNSKNTPGVWTKGSALLGLLQAHKRMIATGSKRVTVGEGGWEILAFDRFAAACVGLVTAPMSLDHVHVIATVLGAQRVTLAGDGDETGRRGVFAGAISLLKYGYLVDAIDVIDPPDGLDPGKMGESEAGSVALERAWNEPQPIVDFIRAREDVARPQQKRELVAVLPFETARTFAERWGMDFDRSEDDADTLAPSARLDTERLAAGLKAELAAHYKLDGFKFTAQGGHASFKAWHAHADDLRARIKNTRKLLAPLQCAG